MSQCQRSIGGIYKDADFKRVIDAILKGSLLKSSLGMCWWHYVMRNYFFKTKAREVKTVWASEDLRALGSKWVGLSLPYAHHATYPGPRSDWIRTLVSGTHWHPLIPKLFMSLSSMRCNSLQVFLGAERNASTNTHFCTVKQGSLEENRWIWGISEALLIHGCWQAPTFHASAEQKTLDPCAVLCWRLHFPFFEEHRHQMASILVRMCKYGASNAFWICIQTYYANLCNQFRTMPFRSF